MSSEKHSFWDSVKGLVVEDVPDKGAQPEAVQPAPSPMAARKTPLPAAPPMVVSPAIDQAARQRLQSVVAAGAPPGYNEITDLVVTLADSIPDEATRFRAAIKITTKHGYPLDALLGAVDHCIGVLEAQGRAFEEETGRQTAAKVGSRQARISNLSETIRTKQDQISALQQEMVQLERERQTESDAISAETAKINMVSQGFTMAFHDVKTELDTLRSKIDTYGKTV